MTSVGTANNMTLSFQDKVAEAGIVIIQLEHLSLR